MAGRRRLDRVALGQTLREHLSSNGPQSRAELQSGLAISQPTFSRVVGEMPGDVLVMGRGPATRYAARRRIVDVTSPIPLYEVLEGADTRVLGALHPVEPRGFFFESAAAGARSRLYPDLPWFLDDLRPSGFLGRQVAARHPDLGPPDVRFWSTDQCLRYLTRFAWDLPGSIVVGEEAFARFLERSVSPRSVAAADRAEVYPRVVEDLLAHGVPGSSAGGEQPKFLMNVEGRPVLVKLSPPTSTEVGERVKDLLVVEHLALETLRAHGHDAARSTLVEAGGRVFLEVERFDRTEAGGRRGLVSLAALDGEHAGVLGAWTATVEALAARRVINDDVVREVRWRELFGQLIANTDMHPQNLSFFMHGTAVTGLAPAYDMSAMRFAPQAHEVVERGFEPRLPGAGMGEVWESAFAAARALWASVGDDARVSPPFRGVAARCLAALGRLEPVGRRLPR